MSSSYKITEQDQIYFMTFQIVGWIDIFTRQVYRDIIIDSFRYCQQYKKFELFAFVIMSNHIHLLARSANNNLSGTIRDLKRHTGRKILSEIQNSRESRRDWMTIVFEYHAKYKQKQDYQIWVHSNHAILVYSQRFIEQKINYIHQNPVIAGIVENAEDYLYSSARNYAGLSSLIDVIIVDFNWKTV